MLVKVTGDVGEAVDKAAVREDLGRPFPIRIFLLIGLGRLDDGRRREESRGAVDLVLKAGGR